jgi:hypothetical protein
MTPALTLEITRQLLRWLSIALIAWGLPPELAALVQHPDVAAQAAATVALLLAESGWMVSKWRAWRGQA